MGIPYRFDPLGTLGAGPRPPEGYDWAESLYMPAYIQAYTPQIFTDYIYELDAAYPLNEYDVNYMCAGWTAWARYFKNENIWKTASNVAPVEVDGLRHTHTANTYTEKFSVDGTVVGVWYRQDMISIGAGTGGPGAFECRVYEVRVSTIDGLVLLAKPVRRKDDGSLHLYDEVSQTILSQNGSFLP